MDRRPQARYESDDRELLMGFYRRLLFRPAFALLPRWVPPNAISIFGAVCSVSAVIAAFVAVRGAPVFYLVCAALCYVYLIADNIDGPQARRMNRSGRLGELIDHGLDGITTGCLLVAPAIILHMAAGWFYALTAIGAMGYVVVIWEQNRTGKLIIPRISCTEGVTIVAGVALIAFFAHEPHWLRFDSVALNPASGLLIFILCCAAAAMIPPCVRLRRAGHAIAPLLTVLFGVFACSLYVVAGSGGLLPAIAVTMFGARVSIRLIVYRQTGVEKSPNSPNDWLVLAPLVPLFLLPNLWHANGWAGVAAIIASLLCFQTLITSVASAHRADRIGLEFPTEGVEAHRPVR